MAAVLVSWCPVAVRRLRFTMLSRQNPPSKSN
jgi:hypothetical protein